MSRSRSQLGFTRISPFRRLPGTAGILRLVFIWCAMFSAAQFIVPLIARLVLNGGQVWPSGEPMYGAVVDDLVLSVPAWLTVATGLVGMIAAVWYLAARWSDAGDDAAYVGMVSLVTFGMLPWAIALMVEDPTGLSTPAGPDSYHFGWNWLATPLSLVVLAVAIAASVASGSRRERQRREARARREARERGDLDSARG